jgi:hypothetical protein
MKKNGITVCNGEYLTGSEIIALRRLYQKIIIDQERFFNELKEVTGLDFIEGTEK